jgi:hypothetical protein|tara:strand:- start:535 stop:1137 length:603 start_codon:yes stop_codon:yes gene_type:complete
MKKLIYVQENFLDPSLCIPFIELAKKNNQEIPYGDESRGGDTFLTTVTHSNPEESLTKGMDVPEPDGNYGAIYLGGEVDPTTVEIDDDELFKTVVHEVTNLCKGFDSDIILDYVGVVRWPVGTFMKPHFDKNDIHGPDVFAAMLYLNDDFDGGSTVFEHIEVKPETGKLVIFSNSQYLHHVSKVEKSERYVLSFWYKRMK